MNKNTQTTQQPATVKKEESPRVKNLRFYCSLIVIVATLIFVAIALLSIWDLFGKDTGEIVWRSFASLATVGFGSLIVAALAPLLDK